MNQQATPISRAELIGYTLESERAKAAAQKAAHKRMAADLVESILKPKVIRAAKEGAYEYEFPLYRRNLMLRWRLRRPLTLSVSVMP